MTPEKLDEGALDELTALLAKATQGEWERDVSFVHAVGESDVANCLRGNRDSFRRSCDNAAAIVALHNAAPALIATAREAAARDAEILRLRNILNGLSNAYEIICNDAGTPYHLSPTSWYATARAALTGAA